MSCVLAFFGALLAWMRGSRASRDAEILFLRQQLLVLKRSAPTRPRLSNSDRLMFVWLYRLFPSLLDAAVIFTPETLVRWHRGGFLLFWRWGRTHRWVGLFSPSVVSLRSLSWVACITITSGCINSRDSGHASVAVRLLRLTRSGLASHGPAPSAIGPFMHRYYKASGRFVRSIAHARRSVLSGSQ